MKRAGFTILELLMTCGVIGTLLGIGLPALNAARESARRVQCVSNLHQVGLALHSYHEVHNALPAGWQWESTLTTGYGWAVPILPYLEYATVYEQVDRNQVIGNSGNAQICTQSLPVLLCPTDITTTVFDLFPEGSTTKLATLPTANYVGVFGTIEPDDSFPAPPGDGSFIEGRSVCFSELERGLSQTLLVGERTMSKVPSTWLGVDRLGEDAACRLTGAAITFPGCSECDECEFDSRHTDGANFLFADGRVRLLSSAIKQNEYQRLAQRSQ